MNTFRLRCFVAMAFERKETDQVYDRLIAPALRRLNIDPIRVDRIEHLEDINNKIISELKRSDFAVADLTFARPSVYFEAGFAQRSFPVIYTCRRDHFSPTKDDIYGNFRIHFDLRMKNIIPWTNPADILFAKKFTKRVNHAIKSILRAKKMQQSRDLMSEEFSSLSLNQKISGILNVSILRLKRAGYRGMEVKSVDVHNHFYARNDTRDDFRERIIERIRLFRPGWIGTRRRIGEICAVQLHVTSSLTERELSELVGDVLRGPLYNISPTRSTGRLKRLIEHIAICSLQKVPVLRIQKTLPSFSLNRATNEYVFGGKLTVSKSRIRNFSELFLPDSYRGRIYEYLAVNPHKNVQHLIFDGRSALDRETSEEDYSVRRKRVAYTVEVPREIHLRIFDDISFEGELSQSIRQWLEQIATSCS